MLPAIIENLIKRRERNSIETGRLAKQANGSVVVKCGGTMLLATSCSQQRRKSRGRFLTSYSRLQRKILRGGEIPGNFFRRETKPSDDEVLTMRLVDRVLRPLFPEDFHAEVQVMISLISYDDKK